MTRVLRRKNKRLEMPLANEVIDIILPTKDTLTRAMQFNTMEKIKAETSRVCAMVNRGIIINTRLCYEYSIRDEFFYYSKCMYA